MTKSLILSAGQGKRLFPLTATRPKCLLRIGGKTVVEWQIEALQAAGVRRSTVVVGFGAEKVVKKLARSCPPPARVRTLFNPKYDVADNLISCWAARDEMDQDFLLLNGDTIFESAVVERLLGSAMAPVTIAIATKDEYDEDDMKVTRDGPLLRRVGKDLPLRETDGESIGMLLFRGEGPRLFREALQRAVARPDAFRRWYLYVINEMAMQGLVQAVSVDGLQWTEIDFPSDLHAADEMVSRWIAEESLPLLSTA